jgi:hypothetical protein
VSEEMSNESNELLEEIMIKLSGVMSAACSTVAIAAIDKANGNRNCETLIRSVMSAVIDSLPDSVSGKLLDKVKQEMVAELNKFHRLRKNLDDIEENA